MKESIEQRVIGLFILMLIVLGYVAWSSIRTIKETIRGNDWVNHTHAVIIDAHEIVSYLNAGDAALRTYLITGDEHDKPAYRIAYNNMIDHWMDAERLTGRNDEEKALHQRFLDLSLLISNRIDVARAMVTERSATTGPGGLDAVRQEFRNHSDAESIDKINRAVRNLTKTENELLAARDKDQVLQAQLTKATVYTGLGVNLVLVILVVWLMRDDLDARRKAARALQEANEHLEAKVQERTADLVKSNQSLKQENLERRWSYQALDHQLRYNQLIINSIEELVFVISRALNISRVNPAVVQRTHWEPQELISQSIDRVLQFPAETGDGGQNPLTQALRDGRQIQDRPANLLDRSGRVIPVQYTLIPLHDQDKIVGGVITVRMRAAVQQQRQS